MKFCFLLLLISHTSFMLTGQSIDSAEYSMNFLIKDVKVFTNNQLIANQDVLVKEGSIVEIRKGIEDNIPRINGTGKTLIPGLTNAHVHAWIPYHLVNALQFGVYTLIDLHSLNEISNQLKALNLKDGYANLYAAGYAATVSGGHGTQFGFQVPVIGKGNNCYQFIDQQVAAGLDHIKIIYEPARATLQLTQIDSLIQRAHHYKKKVIVHISNAKEALDVARLGADGLAHIWRDRPMTTAERIEFSELETFVIPTLTVLEKGLAYKKEKKMANKGMRMAEILEEVKLLHDLGVTLLAGTDPPNFELDYGRSLHRELALLKAAGLSTVEVLRTTTSNIEKALNYHSFSIEKGAKANFILLQGDIEKDVSISKLIASKWVEGTVMNNPE